MNRVAFSIFNVDIYYYSLFILIGIIIAYFLIKFETKKHNIDFNIVSNLLFYTIIIGILGARVYYVVFNISYYLNNLFEIINIRNGGLAIHGGIISAIIFIYYYTKKHKLNFIRILDIIAPSVIIAQSIGRWGNFFNQEAYGKAVSVSRLYNLHIPKFIINGMKIDGIYYYPTFYFESIWCIIGFIIMILLRKYKNLKLGTLTGFYLMFYSFGRFFIEALRVDSLMLFNIKMAQFVSVIGFIIGLVIIIISNKSNELYKK